MLLTSLLLAAGTPTPTPAPEFDETLITPGPLGFAAIFFVAAASVLLIVDMVRRVRRVRYRGEVREEIEREQAAAAAGESAPPAPRPDQES